MPAISFQSKFQDRWSRLKETIDCLSDQNSLKTWFHHELDVLQPADDTSLQLREAHARICALKQISNLLEEHLRSSPSGHVIGNSFRLKKHGELQASPAAGRLHEHFQNFLPKISTHADDSQEHSAEQRDAFALASLASLPAYVHESVRTTAFSSENDLWPGDALPTTAFDPVTPTATVVNHLRCLADGPQAEAPWGVQDGGGRLLSEAGITATQTLESMGVLFQSRYRAINTAISQYADKQIVELAAGMSTRGFEWVQQNHDGIYVESDLPQLMQRKALLIRKVVSRGDAQAGGILHCCAADVCVLEDLLRVIEYLDTSQPITVVTEGLLLYLSSSEMESVWGHMAELMRRSPTITWVTDLVSRENLQQLCATAADVAAAVKNVFANTGRRVLADNPFQDEDAITRWIERFGMNVDSGVGLAECSGSLQSRMPVSQADRRAIVGTRKIWCLRHGTSTSRC